MLVAEPDLYIEANLGKPNGKPLEVERFAESCFLHIPFAHEDRLSVPIEALVQIGGEPQPAENFHLTLLMADRCSDDQLTTFMANLSPIMRFSIEVTGLAILEGFDGNVLVWKIDPGPSLARLQQELHGNATNEGMFISVYSEPSRWVPHITLVDKINPFIDESNLPSIKPFRLMVEKFHIGRSYEDYFEVSLPRGVGDKMFVERHHGPGAHPSGSGQDAHAGDEGGSGEGDRSGDAGFIKSVTRDGVQSTLYLAEEAGLDDFGGKYVATCDKHGTLCNFTNKRTAISHMQVRDWCEECMTAEHGREALAQEEEVFGERHAVTPEEMAALVKGEPILQGMLRRVRRLEDGPYTLKFEPTGPPGGGIGPPIFARPGESSKDPGRVGMKKKESDFRAGKPSLIDEKNHTLLKIEIDSQDTALPELRNDMPHWMGMNRNVLNQMFDEEPQSAYPVGYIFGRDENDYLTAFIMGAWVEAGDMLIMGLKEEADHYYSEQMTNLEDMKFRPENYDARNFEVPYVLIGHMGIFEANKGHGVQAFGEAARKAAMRDAGMMVHHSPEAAYFFSELEANRAGLGDLVFWTADQVKDLAARIEMDVEDLKVPEPELEEEEAPEPELEEESLVQRETIDEVIFGADEPAIRETESNYEIEPLSGAFTAPFDWTMLMDEGEIDQELEEEELITSPEDKRVLADRQPTDQRFPDQREKMLRGVERSLGKLVETIFTSVGIKRHGEHVDQAGEEGRRGGSQAGYTHVPGSVGGGASGGAGGRGRRPASGQGLGNDQVRLDSWDEQSAADALRTDYAQMTAEELEGFIDIAWGDLDEDERTTYLNEYERLLEEGEPGEFDEITEDIEDEGPPTAEEQENLERYGFETAEGEPGPSNQTFEAREYRAMKEALGPIYTSEFEVIDGLNQHPDGLNYKDWLEAQGNPEYSELSSQQRRQFNQAWEGTDYETEAIGREREEVSPSGLDLSDYEHGGRLTQSEIENGEDVFGREVAGQTHRDPLDADMRRDVDERTQHGMEATEAYRHTPEHLRDEVVGNIQYHDLSVEDQIRFIDAYNEGSNMNAQEIESIQDLLAEERREGDRALQAGAGEQFDISLEADAGGAFEYEADLGNVDDFTPHQARDALMDVGADVPPAQFEQLREIAGDLMRDDFIANLQDERRQTLPTPDPSVSPDHSEFDDVDREAEFRRMTKVLNRILRDRLEVESQPSFENIEYLREERHDWVSSGNIMDSFVDDVEEHSDRETFTEEGELDEYRVNELRSSLASDIAEPDVSAVMSDYKREIDSYYAQFDNWDELEDRVAEDFGIDRAEVDRMGAVEIHRMVGDTAALKVLDEAGWIGTDEYESILEIDLPTGEEGSTHEQFGLGPAGRKIGEPPTPSEAILNGIMWDFASEGALEDITLQDIQDHFGELPREADYEDYGESEINDPNFRAFVGREDGQIVAVLSATVYPNGAYQTKQSRIEDYISDGTARKLGLSDEEARAMIDAPMVSMNYLAAKSGGPGYGVEMILQGLKLAADNNAGIMGSAVSEAAPLYDKMGARWFDRDGPTQGGSTLFTPQDVQDMVRWLDEAGIDLDAATGAELEEVLAASSFVRRINLFALADTDDPVNDPAGHFFKRDRDDWESEAHARAEERIEWLEQLKEEGERGVDEDGAPIPAGRDRLKKRHGKHQQQKGREGEAGGSQEGYKHEGAEGGGEPTDAVAEGAGLKADQSQQMGTAEIIDSIENDMEYDFDEEATEAWLRENMTDTIMDLNVSQLKSLAIYKEGLFRSINQVLRGEDAEPFHEEDEVYSYIADIDEVMGQEGTELPEKMVLYRGMDLEDLGQMGRNFDDLKGEILSFDGFTSTTLHAPVVAPWVREGLGYESREGEEPVVVHIIAPEGTKGIWMDHESLKSNLSALSRYSEHEVLLDRGMEFRVVSTGTTFLTGEADVKSMIVEALPQSSANAPGVKAMTDMANQMAADLVAELEESEQLETRVVGPLRRVIWRQEEEEFEDTSLDEDTSQDREDSELSEDQEVDPKRRDYWVWGEDDITLLDKEDHDKMGRSRDRQARKFSDGAEEEEEVVERHGKHEGQEGRKGKAGGSSAGYTHVGTPGSEKPSRRLGITSFKEGDQTPRAQVAQDLEDFVNKIEGVEEHGMADGVFMDNREPSWYIRYHGDGKTLDAAAEEAKAKKQDSVVAWDDFDDGAPSRVGEWFIDLSAAKPSMDDIAQVEQIVKENNMGLTWFQSNGRLLLEVVAVPQYDNDPAVIETISDRVKRYLKQSGLRIDEDGIRDTKVLLASSENGYNWE